MRYGAAAALAAGLCLSSACSAPNHAADSAATHRAIGAHSPERNDALHRARVWTPVAVERMDVRSGPEGDGAFPFLATVDCQYDDKPLRGHSLKFACVLADGDRVKVKVGDTNGEVFAEVAASRLLWTLGFAADRMYPVRVVCHGCPSRFGGRRMPPGGTLFDAATIERPLSGAALWTERSDRVGGVEEPVGVVTVLDPTQPTDVAAVVAGDGAARLEVVHVAADRRRAEGAVRTVDPVVRRSRPPRVWGGAAG